jgi:hypothetical protein
MDNSEDLSTMIEMSCKFVLCVMLTQLGKTFQTINRITTDIEQDDDFGRSVHIVFTMNTLLNNRQFAKRLQTIEETYGKGSICVFTSKYEGPYVHVRSRFELQGLCFDESSCPRVIVACNNSRRYEDCFEFIQVLNKNRTNISRVSVYLDELHEYICDSLRDKIESIHDLDIVKTIMAMTASPDKIWRKSGNGFWSRLRIIQLDHLNDGNYVGFRDMMFNCIDDFFVHPYKRPSPFDFDRMDFETLGFITRVLDQFPEILSDNRRSFIPAHIRRNGHNLVRDLVFQRNSQSIVCVINGFEKTLQFKDSRGNTKTLLLASELDEEVCETIARLVAEHHLQSRPLVITGLLCVGMGQTLTHRSLGSFHSAIFGHLDLTNDEIYQLFGRVTGRMKEWGDSYVQTQIYCPTVIMHRCRIMEDCARAIARDYSGDVITLEDYRKPMFEAEDAIAVVENIRVRKEKNRNAKPKADKSDFDFRVFQVLDDAIIFGASIGAKFNTRKQDATTGKYIAPKELQENGKNPTIDELKRRQWGLSDKNTVRMIPTDLDQWCVYWRPSKLGV